MFLNRVLNFIGYRFINLALDFDNRHQYPKLAEARYKKEDPHEMKRVTYPLDASSLVVDVGGLTGDFASRIYCLYSCDIDVYEPHPELFKRATENFLYNGHVLVFNYGLGATNEKLPLYGDYWNASLYKNDCGNITYVDIKKTSDVFNEKYTHIDLLKLNVEGAEYDILPDLIENYDMRKIDNVQIQFHTTVPDFSKKRDCVRRSLSDTHEMTWCYDYIFENWKLIK